MTTNTNSYAAIKRAGKEPSEDPTTGRAWKEVTPDELAAWIGIVVYMGVHSSPATRDYWKHDGLNPIHPICDYMSQTRFEQIKRYFHVAPPDAPLNDSTTGKRLWHSKVDPALEQLRTSSKAYRVISTHLALDECMMRATGRSADTYKMPSKPIEHGFKFHVVADHGYVWDFHPTSNKEGPDPVPHIDGLTATGEVVYHLLGKLPNSNYWIVYLDNFYTSLPLLGRLRHDFRMGGCGTARPNSAGFPPELKIPKQEVKKHEYHSLKTMVLKDSLFSEEVGAHAWIDNAPVTVLSTVHELGSEVAKTRKRPGIKSTNAKRAREAFGDAEEKEMPIPRCIDDYNQHMGGVDIADQLRSYYDTQLTSFRTWWPMLFWVFDTMVTNAYFIFRDMPQTPPMTHKEFRLQAAWGLILAKTESKTRRTQPDSQQSTRPTVREDTSLPAGRRCDCGHLPVYSEGQRRVCWLCRWKNRGEGKSEFLPKSHWVCSTCDLPLCMTSERNCFTEFHGL